MAWDQSQVAEAITELGGISSDGVHSNNWRVHCLCFSSLCSVSQHLRHLFEVPLIVVLLDLLLAGSLSAALSYGSQLTGCSPDLSLINLISQTLHSYSNWGAVLIALGRETLSG